MTGVYGNVTTLDTQMTGVYGNVTTLDTQMTGVYGNVTTLDTQMTGVYGNVTTLDTQMTGVYGNVTTLDTQVAGVYGNVTTLENLTGGLTGNVSVLTVSAELVVQTVGEVVGNVVATNAIDYTENGNTVYSTNTTTGPYTYAITNVPNLDTNSHIITIIHKASATNQTTCYVDAITVNGSSYTLNWGNGENPSTTMGEISVDDIVTQQIALLPSNFSSGTAISNISYYRSI